jgi:hypothetical protein
MNVLITHDHTSGREQCGIKTLMSIEDLNFVVAWLQSALDDMEPFTPLVEDDCVELLCKFYDCCKIDGGWEQELNLCKNWNTYLCGPLSKERKPFIDRCTSEGAYLYLKQFVAYHAI